jgi:hypothetical protein
VGKDGTNKGRLMWCIKKYPEKRMTQIRFWKFEMIITREDKCTMGSWKFGNKLIGSFTRVK